MSKMIFVGYDIVDCLSFAKKDKHGKIHSREVIPGLINLRYRENWEDYYAKNPKVLKLCDRFGKVLAKS